MPQLLPALSLVVATYNRAEPLRRLLRWLGGQSLERELWEVVVAVDGSKDHTIDVLQEALAIHAYQLRWIVQENGGPASARDRAIKIANGKRIVIIDDDMEPAADFLKAHLEAAKDNPEMTVVIGRINVAANWRSKPLHDVVGEYQRTKLHDAYAAGDRVITSDGFATGNVSMPKALYEACGGFDLSFRIDEDRELGVRLEKDGALFRFATDAAATHHSDVGPLSGWLRRWHTYGATGRRVWEKHGKRPNLHPMRHFVFGSRWNRLLASALLPHDALINPVISIFALCGRILQILGLIAPAASAYKAILALQYNRGVRDAFDGMENFMNEAKQLRVIASRDIRQP